MNQGPRIALIHALKESVLPAHMAFTERWPEAYIFDIIETSLASDLAHRGHLDHAMAVRITSLANYAYHCAFGTNGKTAGILFTCSAFGSAIDCVKHHLPVPVLRPNEAAFELALHRGSRLGIIVTFEPSLTSLESELRAMAASRGRTIVIEAVLAQGALDALMRKDEGAHNRLVADAGLRLRDVDAIILGQFSIARARATVEAVTGKPVITTPHSAVDALRRALTV